MARWSAATSQFECDRALAGAVTSAYEVFRFSYLGYQQLFGVATPEEETERLSG
ncbi:hypothetical protein [Leisingera sp. NJS201]|uniref:hypothetical protein n=1 Tax=Leisingera sp. NJS201 TaxID=2508306 RepID=UPI0014300FDB|nr:hypothetical protein [Leisingera sp. NJS201]